MVKTIKETETRTVTEEKTIYVTQDGTRFTDEEQAKMYDSSAKAVIMAKFKAMEKRITGMENFTFGCSDDVFIFIKMKESYKADLIQLLHFTGWCSDSYVEKIQACKEGEELCLRGYLYTDKTGLGFDYLSVLGTVEDVKKAFEEDLNSTDAYVEKCKERIESENTPQNSKEYWRNFLTFFGLNK